MGATKKLSEDIQEKGRLIQSNIKDKELVEALREYREKNGGCSEASVVRKALKLFLNLKS